MDNVWHELMFSCESEHWNTPKELLTALDADFHFTLDPCPSGGDGGLALSWKGHRVYCNPPYGRGVDRWLAKHTEADVSVYLLPSRTDTKWFHKYAPLACVRFLRGRLCFNDGPKLARAPFPSCLLIFGQCKP